MTINEIVMVNNTIELPCNIGDTVYEFFDVAGFYDISELIVENIIINLNPFNYVICAKSKQSRSVYTFDNSTLGRCLFFSKEDVEAKMNEVLQK